MKTRHLLLLILLLALLATTVSAGPPADTAPPDYAEIDDFILSEMARAGIPGLSLAIVQGDEVIYLQGYGRADNAGREVTAQTPFNIGSISKTLTALAIQQLASQGLIDRRAPVQLYLPDFTLADPEAAARITVQHLLDHTSGIPKSAGEQAYQLDPRYSTAELVEMSAGVAPNRPVGASHEYSNVNYLLLGQIVEAVSGKSYTEYVRDHILQPLEMTRTVFSEQEAAGLASGYRTNYGLRVPAAIPIPTGMIPSGYAISTAEDLSHYLAAYLNNGRFGDATVLEATGPLDVYWNRLPGSAAGLETGQSGGTLNFNGDIFMLPGQEVGVAVLTNSRNLWDDVLPVTTAATIARGVAYRVAGLPTPAAPPLSLWQSYLLLDLLALLVLGWALFRLWRSYYSWHETDPPRGLAIISVLADLGVGLALLVGIPYLAAQRWGYILRTQTDLAGLVFIAALILIAAGLIRLVRLFTRRRQREEAAGPAVAVSTK